MSVVSSNADDPDPMSVATRNDLARELTKLREQAGLSIRTVAKSIGVPASTIGGYFTGRYLPSVSQSHQLTKILRACDLTEPVDTRPWLDALARVRTSPGRRPAEHHRALPWAGKFPA